MIDNITDRFPQIELLTALDILDPTAMMDHDPGASELDLDYGRTHLETLIDHFCTSKNGLEAPLDETQLRAEFPGLMQYIFKNKSLSLWRPLLKKGNVWVSSCKLASISLVKPTNTGCCERGFSAVNIIKNFLTNRMNSDILNARMQIKINGPEVCDQEGLDSLLELSFETWNSLKKRVPERGSRLERPRQKKKVDSLMSLLQRMKQLADAEKESDEPLREGQEVEMQQRQMDEVGQFEPPPDMDYVESLPEDAFVISTPSTRTQDSDGGESVEVRKLKVTKLKNKYVAVKHTTQRYIGKIKSVSNSKKCPGYFIIVYNGEDKNRYTHDLNRLEYGIDGDWVLVQKKVCLFQRCHVGKCEISGEQVGVNDDSEFVVVFNGSRRWVKWVDDHPSPATSGIIIHTVAQKVGGTVQLCNGHEFYNPVRLVTDAFD